ncbi:MAG: MarR family transcriptional regulator, partial [Nevskia sp.]|nr:MarR family transcriptional regulator [Nevskia sp.]
RNFGFLVKDVSRLSARNFERHAKALKLTLSQCRVLTYLSRNEGINQIQLAMLTETDPMTLVRILDRMEKDQWIERRADPDDRRARRLYLQAGATPILEQIWLMVDRSRGEAMAGLNAGEQKILMDLLERVRSNLTELVPNAGEVGISSHRDTVAVAPLAVRAARARKVSA